MMETKNSKCTSCYHSLSSFLRLSREELFQFLRAHGVILESKLCDICNMPCRLSRDMLRFSCGKTSLKQNPWCPTKKHLDGLSVRKNTIFENSHLKVEKICSLIAMQVTMSPPPTNTFLMTEFKLSTRAISDWVFLLRNIYYEWAFGGDTNKLGGPGKIVELGYSKFQNQGTFGDQWLVRGYERESKLVSIIPVMEKNRVSLLKVIKNNILPGTTIMSPLWKDYNCLKDKDFTSDYKLVEPDDQLHTQTIKRFWRDLVDYMPKFGGQRRNFEGYIAEFMFKKRFFNHLERIHEIFALIGKLYNPNVRTEIENIYIVFPNSKRIKIGDEIDMKSDDEPDMKSEDETGMKSEDETGMKSEDEIDMESEDECEEIKNENPK